MTHENLSFDNRAHSAVENRLRFSVPFRFSNMIRFVVLKFFLTRHHLWIYLEFCQSICVADLLFTNSLDTLIVSS